MPDNYKDIEELFKDAASNASGPPPPPADWGAMSSMLQESALIQTGAGASAAKVGLLKTLGTKAMMLKVVAGTVIVGGGLTGSYVLLKDEPADVAANTIDQTIQPENKSIDPNTTIGYNDHLSKEHLANDKRAKSSSLLNIHAKEGAESPLTIQENAQSQQTESTETQATSDKMRSTTPQGEQLLSSSKTAIPETEKSTPQQLSTEAENMFDPGYDVANSSKIAYQNTTDQRKEPTESSSKLAHSLESSNKDNETVDDKNANSLTAHLSGTKSDAQANPNDIQKSDTQPLVATNETKQTNTNTSNSPENTVDADKGTFISANSNTSPSVSTGTTPSTGATLLNNISNIDNEKDKNTTSGTGNVTTQLVITEHENNSTPEIDSSPNSSLSESQSFQTDVENSKMTTASSEQTSNVEEAQRPVVVEEGENANSLIADDLESSRQTINQDVWPSDVDSSTINSIALTDNDEQATGVNTSQTDSLIEASDSSAPQIGSITMRPKEPRWLISPYLSIDRSNYTIDQFTLSNLAGSTNDLQIGSNGATFSAGIRGAYNIAPYLWLESGFLYSKKSGIQGIMELYDDNGEVTALANYQLTGDFYEIPLALGVRSNNGYFGWYFKAGVNLAYNRASTSSFFEYYDFEVEKVFTIKPSIRTLNPVIAASAGFEYNILPQLRFYAEPNFRFATRPVLNTPEFDQIPLNPKWSTIGLGIGINYYLGKR